VKNGRFRNMNVGLTSMKRKLAALSALAAVALLNGSIFGAPQEAAPLPFVSPIFGDNMVL
jgi:hypothetical protein